MDTFNTIELSSGKTVKLCYDSDTESPRRAFDNFGTVVAVGNYKHLSDDPSHRIGAGIEYDSRLDFIEQGADLLRRKCKAAVILPIHVYKHSSIALSTSMGYPFNDRWDSGTCGFIYVTKETIRNEYGIKRVTQKYLDKAEQILKGEIETLSQWLNGEVCGFSVEDENGTEIDSCYGFYGTDPNENGMVDNLNVLNENELKEFLENS